MVACDSVCFAKAQEIRAGGELINGAESNGWLCLLS
jgi:hypothetical protein